jgi:hypothetical protein
MQDVHDMTNTQNLLDVSKALAAQLWNALKDDPQTNTIVTSEDQITFSTPKTALAAKKKLAIYLYCIIPDQSGKNVPPTAGADMGKTRQTSFTARYLITPCTGNTENDLLLLGKTLQTLSDTPFITANAAENGSSTLTVTLDSLSLGDLGKLWTALGEPLKPSLSATIAFGAEVPTQQTSPAPAPATNPRAMELYQTVFDTFEQQVNDWKNRNLFQKQYVQSDFAKNTGMTVEAMRTELKDQGLRLEANRPTESCMEALKRLQEFYQHQLDMLKGFEKVQKKRQEGIDMVTKWKNDATALIEALNTQHQ